MSELAVQSVFRLDAATRRPARGRLTRTDGFWAEIRTLTLDDLLEEAELLEAAPPAESGGSR